VGAAIDLGQPDLRQGRIEPYALDGELSPEKRPVHV
jgi:hypothetical protein